MKEIPNINSDDKKIEQFWSFQSKVYLPCPHCKTSIKLGDSSLFHTTIKSQYSKSLEETKYFFEKLVHSGSWGRFKKWVCNACLETEHFAFGDVSEQPKAFLPVSWYQSKYVDACRICDQSFVFTANEQKYWYEVAKIGRGKVDVPKVCLSCRQKERKRNSIAAPLKDLLVKIKDNPTKEDYEALASIYEALGNKQKAGTYRQRAKFFRKKK